MQGIDGAIVTDSIFVYAKNETVTPEPTPGDNSQNQGDAGNGSGSGSGSADGGAMTASVGNDEPQSTVVAVVEAVEAVPMDLYRELS